MASTEEHYKCPKCGSTEFEVEYFSRMRMTVKNIPELNNEPRTISNVIAEIGTFVPNSFRCLNPKCDEASIESAFAFSDWMKGVWERKLKELENKKSQELPHGSH